MSKINETNYPRRTQANYEDTDMLVIQEAGGNTYTTRIEDLREDCQETLAPALNTMRENLATIEGSTASKAYAKGDFLIFGGRLCKAKTSIAVNATLVLDTNIELDSVGDELSSINSDLASYASSHIFATAGGPTGNHTLASLQQWCKDNASVYYIGSIYVNIFGNWYWSQVMVNNKLISPGYAQIIIINHAGICFSQSSSLVQATPTWSTGQTLFTAV